MQHDSTIAIKSNSLTIFICRKINVEQFQVLLMQREESINSESWEVSSTQVKPAEIPWQAALNEIRKETSHVPDRIYVLDKIRQRYDTQSHSIQLSPIFVAFFDHDQLTKPLLPGVSSTWVNSTEAKTLLVSPELADIVDQITRDLIFNEPNPQKKVYPTRF